MTRVRLIRLWSARLRLTGLCGIGMRLGGIGLLWLTRLVWLHSRVARAHTDSATARIVHWRSAGLGVHLEVIVHVLEGQSVNANVALDLQSVNVFTADSVRKVVTLSIDCELVMVPMIGNTQFERFPVVHVVLVALLALPMSIVVRIYHRNMFVTVSHADCNVQSDPVRRFQFEPNGLFVALDVAF